MTTACTVSLGELLLSSLLILVFVPVVATFLEEGIGWIKKSLRLVPAAPAEQS